MPPKKRIKVVNINIAPGAFTYIFKKFAGEKPGYEFSSLESLRKILNNEKARILYTIKEKSPDSIYQLAKSLKRDFKSVREDVLLLERFGFLELEKKFKGKRKLIKPTVSIDTLQVNFEI
jgi:predicted transcriptional regulator